MKFLIERDGEHCLICGIKPNSQTKLQIDHADNNPFNWDPSNLHLICQKDNLNLRSKSVTEHKWIINNYVAANARRSMCKHVADTTTNIKEKFEYSGGSAEMRANSYFETQFVDWIFKELNQHELLPKKEIINSGAHVIGCSQITAARYLEKLTSLYGPLEITKDSMGLLAVKFREKFKTNPEITPQNTPKTEPQKPDSEN